MMDNYFLLFASPLILSFLITPFILRYALRSGAIDEPDWRKVHSKGKPLLGGLSLYLAILISTVAFYDHNIQLYTLLVSLTIIVIVGIVDDLHGLNPYAKLAGHFIAATVLVAYNISEFALIFDFLEQFIVFRIVAFLVVIVWVVAITNAFNLIDGLDGLAVGNAVIIGSFLILLSLLYGNMWALGISIILVGACLGFFPFNYRPARIFLGDTGSTLLGFVLASIFLFNVSYEVPKFMLFGVVFLFMYPTVDLGYAMIRRLREGVPIMSADMNHIHHHILRGGLPSNYVVYLLYGFSFLVGVCGVFVMAFSEWMIFVVVAAIALLIVLLAFVFRLLFKNHQTHLVNADLTRKRDINK